MDPRMRRREIAHMEEEIFRRTSSDSPSVSSKDILMSDNNKSSLLPNKVGLWRSYMKRGLKPVPCLLDQRYDQ